jgi:hypothetical protein
MGQKHAHWAGDSTSWPVGESWAIHDMSAPWTEAWDKTYSFLGLLILSHTSKCTHVVHISA